MLKEVFIENVDVTGGAPYSLVVKGYPTADTSYIGMTLRNITFSGLKNSPHYVIENVDSIEFSEVYVQVWQQWKSTDDVPGAAHSLVASSTFIMVVVSVFLVFVKLYQ